MLQVILRSGLAEVVTVPAPLLEPGTVLVKTAFSCISSGTEGASLANSGQPLWKRALAQPANVNKVVEATKSLGIRRTWELVQGKLSGGSATGYSLAGTVIAVGDGVTDLAIGDRVACAGAGVANHAETVRVPRNLLVLLDPEDDLQVASTVTMGAIALQGVRRAAVTLGETVVVLGLGALGQLTSQLLRVAGARTIGIDLDAKRVDLAVSLGLDLAVRPGSVAPEEQVAQLTRGIGADAVIVTAASGDDLLSLAFRMTRKKGRVVLVGDVGMKINRGDVYQKELDFFVSTSYGPGRYDSAYEEHGLDYPVSYVRWTENRNMEEYLRLANGPAMHVRELITSVFDVGKAADAYAALMVEPRPILAVLRYPDGASPALPQPPAPRRAPRVKRAALVRIGIIGAGAFAQGMHVPNLQRLSSRFRLTAVCSRSGVAARALAGRYGAAIVSTDPEELLKSEDVDAVIIATRHDSHASLALSAIQHGKHVLLEKPLCMNWDEQRLLDAALPTAESQGLVFLTGYNRRFSQYGVAMNGVLRGRSHPMMITYRMNAGYLPTDHWTQGVAGGGRNLGEACHIYDFLRFLVGSEVTRISATHAQPRGNYYLESDNFVATLGFADGSVGTLLYTAMGARTYPKERCEVFSDGRVILLDDFRKLDLNGNGPNVATRSPEKGQFEELEAFGRAISEGASAPIPIAEQLEASRIALAVEDLRRR